MRNLYLILLISLFTGATASAQVKIGDNPQNIDPSSVLELESTDKVLVITRVTTTQMNAIVPSQGALCFNTDLQSVHYYDGTQWVNIGGGGTGGPLTADAIVNTLPTIVITPTATGDNLEVAPNSIRSEQIVDGGVNGVDIQDGSIGPGKLQDFSVTQEKLSENAVGAFALDNDNIDLGDFNNAAGYITAADVNIVGNSPGNAITADTNGGAFYDDTDLLMDVMDNATDIAADNDQDANNELQTLSIAGNQLSISSQNTITLPSTTGEIDDNELITNAVLSGTNLVITEAGTDFTVPLASLSGGSTEVVDGTTLTGIGTAVDPFKIEPGSTGQVLTTDATGVVWSTITPGGSTEVVDGTTLTGVGTAVDPFKIEPGTTGQFLTTSATGVVWSTIAPGGSTEVVDGTTLTGVGTAVDPFKIEPSTTVGQYLRTTVSGVVWDDVIGTGVTTDGSTIVGTGVDIASQLTIPTSGITTTQIADATILAEDLNNMGATSDGDEIEWDTALNLGAGGWKVVPGSTGAGEANIASSSGTGGVSVVLPKNGVDLPFKSINVGPTGILGVTDDTAENEIEIDIVPATALPTPADQMLITSAAGDVEWAPAGHTGTPKSIFFAGDDGKPTQFFHPAENRPSFYWDYEGRTLSGISYGALAIGIDGPDRGGITPTLSNEVKVHIGESLSNRVSYSLLLQNFWDSSGPSTGSGVGILFASDRFTDGKGALIFERRDDFGVGDFHFLQNNNLAQEAPELATDKAFTITKDKDIRLYGGIEIDGTGPGTGLGTSGQVLSSTGTGVQWISGGGGLTISTDTPNSITTGTDGGILYDDTALSALVAANTVANAADTDQDPTNEIELPTGGANGQVLSTNGSGIYSWVANSGSGLTISTDTPNSITTGTDGGILYDDTALNALVAANTTANTADTDQDPTNEIELPTGGTSGQVLSLDAGLNPIWSTGGTSNNLATDNQVQDAEDRTYDLNGQDLFFTGAGSIGIGTTTPQAKLHISGGQVRAATLSAGNGDLAYRFSDDPDTGMYSILADDIGFKTGNQEILLLSESVANGLEITAKGSLELEEALIDINGNAGNSGQVLTSTSTGTEWKNPSVVAMGKANGANSVNVNGVTIGGGAGINTVTFTNPRPDADYIIQLTAQDDFRIYVTNQTINGFTVETFDNGTSALGVTTWYFTILDF